MGGGRGVVYYKLKVFFSWNGNEEGKYLSFFSEFL